MLSRLVLGSINNSLDNILSVRTCACTAGIKGFQRIGKDKPVYYPIREQRRVDTEGKTYRWVMSGLTLIFPDDTSEIASG